MTRSPMQAELLKHASKRKVQKCKCAGTCNTRTCPCKKEGIDCSSFCHIWKDCENKKYHSSSTPLSSPPSSAPPPPPSVNRQSEICSTPSSTFFLGKDQVNSHHPWTTTAGNIRSTSFCQRTTTASKSAPPFPLSFTFDFVLNLL